MQLHSKTVGEIALREIVLGAEADDGDGDRTCEGRQRPLSAEARIGAKPLCDELVVRSHHCRATMVVTVSNRWHLCNATRGSVHGWVTMDVKPRNAVYQACLSCRATSMTGFNPLSTTGVVVRLDGDQQRFLGSTFAFRTRLHFLTAAHCVGDLDPSAIAIVLPRQPTPQQYSVRSIDRHPKADLALLTLDSEAVPFPFLLT